jgi:drug/metabolite transporter (DMT)-like permease
MPSKSPIVPFLAVIVGGVATGFTPIFVRLSDVGPVASAFWRFALAVPLLWAWLLWHERRRAPRPGSALARSSLVGLAGLFLACDLGTWHWAVLYTTVANATFIGNISPIFVALVAVFLFHERLSRPLLYGMLTAFAGVVFMAGPNVSVGDTRWVGDALTVLAAVFFAAYLLAIKHVRASVSTARVMALSTTVSALVLLPVAWLLPQPMLPADAGGWGVVFLLALVPQIIGQGSIAYAFAHLPVTLSAVGLMVQPIVAALLAWWLFGETLGWAGLIGGALVLAGIFLSRRAVAAS